MDIYVVYLDPSDTKAQISAINVLSCSINHQAHSVIVGDYNFVESNADRFIKQSRSWSMGDDLKVAASWTEGITAKGFKEWTQQEFTHENGICFSRLDRVYSSLHTSYYLLNDAFCYVLDRDSSLSAHRPICFGFRYRRRPSGTYFPSWVLHHPEFVHSVQCEFEHLSETAGNAPFDKLCILKKAMKWATSHLIRTNANKEAV